MKCLLPSISNREIPILPVLLLKIYLKGESFYEKASYSRNRTGNGRGYK